MADRRSWYRESIDRGSAGGDGNDIACEAARLGISTLELRAIIEEVGTDRRQIAALARAALSG